MSIGLADRKPIDLELRLAVTGLAFGLVALALWASMERPRMLYASAAAFGPEDLKAWGLAVAAFASSIATAVASLIVAGKGLIRFGQWLFAPTPKRPRKPRKKAKADAPKPDPPPVA